MHIQTSLDFFLNKEFYDVYNTAQVSTILLKNLCKHEYRNTQVTKYRFCRETSFFFPLYCLYKQVTTNTFMDRPP